MTEAHPHGGMVIAGAGEAGARAAQSLRACGFQGPITLIGDETRLPYERPPLSKSVMTATVDPPAPATILPADDLIVKSITHLSGTRVEVIDRPARAVHLSDGRSIPYTKLLIATGAAPRRLDVRGAAGSNVLYLRTFADALALRARLGPQRRILIVGGGFIGLELASSAVARGASVTLLEAAPRLLMRGVPAPVAARVEEIHRAAGVEIFTGLGIERIDGHGERPMVRLSNGRVVVCDAVVAGVGAIPETWLARSSGLAVDNGVRVDRFLRTDDPHIYAAGDCCSFPHSLYGGRRIRLEAWRNAQAQGQVAAANMLGAQAEFNDVPWFWSDQYDQTLQVAGLSDEGGDTIERRLAGGSLFFQRDANGRLMAASAIGSSEAIARDMRLAEMLIARRATPDPIALASPNANLKALVREPRPRALEPP